MMRKTILFILAILFSSLVTNTVADAENPLETVTTAYSRELKILSWNIYMLPHFNIKNSNRLRANAIAKELSRSDYAIIVFQEAFDNRARKKIMEVLEENFPFFYGPANNSRWYSIHTSSGLWKNSMHFTNNKNSYPDEYNSHGSVHPMNCI